VTAHDDDARAAAAARAYLSARVELMGAVAGTMLAATAVLDERFHELVVACGFSCADLDCWHCEREDER